MEPRKIVVSRSCSEMCTICELRSGDAPGAGVVIQLPHVRGVLPLRRQAFRKDVAVDIHALPFSYDVTYIDTTEYLRYTVDVTKNCKRHCEPN